MSVSPIRLNTTVDFDALSGYGACMNAQELKKLLAAKGCTFHTKRAGSGHLTVKLGDRITDLPMHGSRKELGTGLVNSILKDLGLK